MRSYPGKSSCPDSESFREESSNGPERGETLIGEGTEDGRSAYSTEDSGPEKPGNRVEEKTLTTPTEGGGNPETSLGCGKTQTRGRGDNQGESRQRGRGKGQQTKRGARGELWTPKGSPGGHERSGPSQGASLHPAIFLGRQSRSRGSEDREGVGTGL